MMRVATSPARVLAPFPRGWCSMTAALLVALALCQIALSFHHSPAITHNTPRVRSISRINSAASSSPTAFVSTTSPSRQQRLGGFRGRQINLSSDRIEHAGAINAWAPSLSVAAAPAGVFSSASQGSGVRRSRSTRLWMSTAAPPVKPPTKKRLGGGRGDDLYVRELIEPEKTELLTQWRAFCKVDRRRDYTEALNTINDMIAFTTGIVAARKRQFTLACCKGTAVQAVACVQIGPKNDDVQSFIGREACMYVRLLVVDPVNPQFKPGEHLLKELKEIGKMENIPVSFQPIKNVYSGRFYAATLVM